MTITMRATVIQNIAVMGCVNLGYRAGETVAVHRVDINGGDRWADTRGIVLPDECITFRDADKNFVSVEG